MYTWSELSLLGRMIPHLSLCTRLFPTVSYRRLLPPEHRQHLDTRRPSTPDLANECTVVRLPMYPNCTSHSTGRSGKSSGLVSRRSLSYSGRLVVVAFYRMALSYNYYRTLIDDSCHQSHQCPQTTSLLHPRGAESRTALQMHIFGFLSGREDHTDSLTHIIVHPRWACRPLIMRNGKKLRPTY